MRLLNTVPITATQSTTINPKNDVAKESPKSFLSSLVQAGRSTLKVFLGKTVAQNTRHQDIFRESITHVHNAKFDNNASISTESAYGVMGNDTYEKVYKFHTASFSQGKAQDHINQYRKDLPMGTEDMEKFSDKNYDLRNFKEIGQRQYKNGQSRKVVTLELQKELNQKRLLASKGSEYGSCAAFSAMWLSDIEHGKTTPEQSERRMDLLTVGAREAAIRQKIYSDDFFYEDFLHVKNNQEQTQAQAKVLKFAGLDMVTEKKSGRLYYDDYNFERLVNAIKPGEWSSPYQVDR